MMRGVIGVVLAIVSGLVAAGAAQPVNEDAAMLAAIDKRIKDYVALHQKLEATLPPLSKEATADAIDKHGRALAALLHRARPDAKYGDIFPSLARATIRRYLQRVLSGPDGRKIRAAIFDEDNLTVFKVQVNGRYPDGAPRSSVPLQVLQMLPKLPEELEYRFIAHRLILVDIHAGLVVDYVDNALPN